MKPNGHNPPPLDLAALRARCTHTNGRDFWRSLEELAESEAFQELLHREFPANATEWTDGPSRRRFLQLMAASLALAGLGGCAAAPDEKIVPYVRAPEQVIPGRPLFFATAMPLAGYALGLLVESHMGRPIKVEGNPDHPASLGATDVFAQASVLTLYDPDRSQVVSNAGRITTWSAFLQAATLELEKQRASRGAGLRILTETVTSPAFAAQLRALLRQFPNARWHQYEPANRDNVYEGARLAFGRPVNTVYHFDRADVILSLDADFLCAGPGGVRYARDFADRRRADAARPDLNRLYVVESSPTPTGLLADHRLPLRSAEVALFAAMLRMSRGPVAHAFDPDTRGLRAIPQLADKLPELARLLAEWLAPHKNWLGAVVIDLRNHRGASLIIPGDSQPPIVHALAHDLNAMLGNIGSTVTYTDPVEAEPVNQTESLAALVADMNAGRVEFLVIFGGNPVYTAPADFRFADALARVPFRVHLSLYDDETSNLCHWHVPEAHFLETWGDARAFDGTITLQQPLIAPLYDGKSPLELLAALMGQPGRSGYDLLREYWRSQRPADGFEEFWQRSLHDGLIAGSALPERRVSLRPEYRGRIEQELTAATGAGLEVNFRTDPTIFDGRFSNNGWLQELPKPISKLTWDNAAYLSPATASRLGLRNEDVVELHHQGRTVEASVWILPGQAEDCVTLHIGYGCERTGRVGRGAGFNAYRLRTSAAPWFDAGLEIRKTGRRYPLACTQDHHSMEGRHLVRVGTVGEYEVNPHLFHEMAHEPPPELSLYPGHPYDSYAWGMTIDLNACTGCNACVVACVAENNIPVVGKDQVLRGREMHWIRVDRYFAGPLDNPEIYPQPLPCMQCENAPCEVVCPVAATAHSSEGLNDMVYNRCIGTRYCSNNCPYKVRRFNFLQYSDVETPSLRLLRNPDVTLRSRGVMEKCTYCVQRINAARIEAKKEDRPIRDGDIATACQAACPTQAITFGNINDRASRVAQLKASPRNYGILTDLNTRPRTTYLARLRNPNPALEVPTGTHEH